MLSFCFGCLEYLQGVYIFLQINLIKYRCISLFKMKFKLAYNSNLIFWRATGAVSKMWITNKPEGHLSGDDKMDDFDYFPIYFHVLSHIIPLKTCR